MHNSKYFALTNLLDSKRTMTGFPKTLKDGFSRFNREQFRNDQRLYQTLAEKGQNPKIMLIGCSDSRIDPMAIFGAGPGDLFVVRNVANLVPPFETDGQYHGVSSALEYGVKHLDVDHIVILGHTDCGGVKAMLDMELDNSEPDGFITKWIAMMAQTRDRVMERNKGADAHVLHHEMKISAIQTSLNNLKSFKFIADNITAGKLNIHGAYFNIAEGQVYVLDQSLGTYSPL